MSKGGGGSTRTITSTTGATPFAQPFLKFGVEEAKRLYESPTPQYYPESTVVGFSPESEMALSATRDYAMQPNPLVQGVQQAVMQNLQGTNPLQSAAFRPALEQVEGALGKAGRYGSQYGAQAMAQSLAPLALQAQQQAIAQAPSAYQFGLAPAQMLAGVGAAREAQEQAELAADIERFTYGQNLPLQKLADYMTLVQGGSGALGTQQATPMYASPAAGFLGGALGAGRLALMAQGEGSGMASVLPYALGGGLLGGMA